MSQDLSIVITSVYTLADIQTDTLDGESENHRQHGAQNDVREQHLNEHRSSAFCSSGDRIGDGTTKHNAASLKAFDVAGSIKRSVQRGENNGTNTKYGIFPRAESLPSRNSHGSVFDGDGVMTSLSVNDFCPSFCCRKNDALVRKLRAKSRLVDNLQRKPFFAVGFGDSCRAKRSTNDDISVYNSSNRVLSVTQTSESKYPRIVNECSTSPNEPCEPVEGSKISSGVLGDSIKDEVTSHEFQFIKSVFCKEFKVQRDQEDGCKKGEDITPTYDLVSDAGKSDKEGIIAEKAIFCQIKTLRRQ